MLSKEPIDFGNIGKGDIDKQALRWGMIAELDAINFYEQLAANVKDPKIKKVFLDIAREEKTHVGEFETMLLEKDAQQVNESEKAKKEVKELGK